MNLDAQNQENEKGQLLTASGDISTQTITIHISFFALLHEALIQ